MASTGETVGTVVIDLEVVVQIETKGGPAARCARLSDGNLTGSGNMTLLQLHDKHDSLGLPQDALDSLAQLANDFATKAMNEALAKGVNVHLPSAATGFPVSLLKPDISFVEHAVHVNADVEVDAKSFAEIVGNKGIKADSCKQTKDA